MRVLTFVVIALWLAACTAPTPGSVDTPGPVDVEATVQARVDLEATIDARVQQALAARQTPTPDTSGTSRTRSTTEAVPTPTPTALAPTSTPEALPNLVLYKPRDWQNAVVVSGNAEPLSPSEPAANVPSFVSFAVRNAGTVKVGQRYEVHVFVDGQQVKTEADPSLLAPGAFATWARAQIQATPGSHTIRLVVDPGNAVRESNEADNTFELTVLFAPPPKLPNLKPQTKSGWAQAIILSGNTTPSTPEDPRRGRVNYVSWSITNAGDADVTGAFSVDLMGLDNNTGGLRLIRRWTVDGLKAGESYSVENHQVQDKNEDFFTVSIRVDVDKLIGESDDSDNSVGAGALNWVTLVPPNIAGNWHGTLKTDPLSSVGTGITRTWIATFQQNGTEISGTMSVEGMSRGATYTGTIDTDGNFSLVGRRTGSSCVQMYTAVVTGRAISGTILFTGVCLTSNSATITGTFEGTSL